MPDSAQGNHPLNADLVDDALSKASQDGIRYCFTWNVRQLVLFDSHIQGVPYAERNIEGPADVVDAAVSDDVGREWARDAIRRFWEAFLERFADLLAGRRAFEPSPIDQRFIGWIEGALEDPIAHTEDALGMLSRTDPGFRERDLRRTAAWADANAGANYFEDYDDLDQLKRLDWEAIQASDWRGRQEGKQAEFLVEDSFPWELASRVGVHSRRIGNRVLQAMQGSSHRPPVEIKPGWYY